MSFVVAAPAYPAIGSSGDLCNRTHEILRNGSTPGLFAQPSSLRRPRKFRHQKARPYDPGQGNWWTLPDLNRRHSACRADALPSELKARVRVVAPLQVIHCRVQQPPASLPLLAVRVWNCDEGTAVPFPICRPHNLAEREGFEPSCRLSPTICFPSSANGPLWQRSIRFVDDKTQNLIHKLFCGVSVIH